MDVALVSLRMALYPAALPFTPRAKTLAAAQFDHRDFQDNNPLSSGLGMMIFLSNFWAKSNIAPANWPADLGSNASWQVTAPPVTVSTIKV